MRHHWTLPITSVLTGAAVAASLAAAPAAAGSTAPAGARGGHTDIGLQAGAFGTRLAGGDLPAGSGMTAFSIIGCTPKVGKARHNEVAATDLPGLGTVSGVKTRVWTRKKAHSRHSFARSSTAEVVLADTALGSLSIRGVTSRTHAWHNRKGFHSHTRTSVGSIVFTAPGGDEQVLDLPTPDQPIVVPGLARIALGGSQEHAGRQGARAWAVALRVKVIPTGTDLYVSRSRAQALPGIKHGRFGGYSAGTEANVLGGVLTSGRNPLELMPCQGTHGTAETREDADVDLGGGLHVEAVEAKQWAKRFKHRSKAWERGKVTGLDIGDGAVVVDAVIGKAKVVRKANGHRQRSAKGTRIGSVTVNGEQQELPLDETLEVPGVAKLEPKVVTRLRTGLKVVGLRVSLLDGSGAVLDLGVAKTKIRR